MIGTGLDYQECVEQGLIDVESHTKALNALEKSVGSAWLPPPTTTLDQWMDQNFVLVPESSSEPNTRWVTIPYQRGIAKSMCDPAAEIVDVLKSARVGYTKLITGYIGYRISLDPCSILMVQPSLEDAQGYSTEELGPMIRDVDVVGARMAGTKKVLNKTYQGGALTIGGAHSGRIFRRITAEVAILDEVDGYPPSAGSEGDQIALAWKRLYTAAFPKMIIGSSPKLKEASRIDAQWALSDQRDYMVPCPLCDEHQRLKWGGRDKDYGIKWPQGEPEKAYYLCEHCLKAIPYSKQRWMVEEALKNPYADMGWIAGKPERKTHHGFRIWSGYSPFQQAAWGTIAKEFLECGKDPAKLQVFVNTTLGESWEEGYETVSPDNISNRAEYYIFEPGEKHNPDTLMNKYLVPWPVVALTAGIDVQADRLELQVDGWGRDEECWKLRNRILQGDPTGSDVWDDLWEALQEPFKMERGGVDFIRSWCIDSGYLTNNVEAFVRYRQKYRTDDGVQAYGFQVKGTDGAGLLWPREASKVKKKAPLFIVHVDAGKEWLYSGLARVLEPGPKYIHFPVHREFSTSYFQQLTAEKVELTKSNKGFPVRTWMLKPGQSRNEALDTANYSLCALRALESMGFDLEKYAQLLHLPVRSTDMSEDLEDDKSDKPSRRATRKAKLEASHAIEEALEPAPMPKSNRKKRSRSRIRVARSTYLGG